MPFRLPERGVVRVRTSSTAADTVSTNELDEGELALNSASGVLYFQTAANAVGQFPSSTGINRIVQITQEAYNALTPDPNTLYVIT